jgi:hypothetical protein
MNKAVSDLEQVIALAANLSLLNTVRLVQQVMATLEQELTSQETKPKRSLYGICADLGTAPSAEEIDEARREAWANFPREDI